MSAFYLPESTATTAAASPLNSPRFSKYNPLETTKYDNSDSDSDTPLPFPQALPRADFLTQNFTPELYLSTLSNRHQTLEDLRSDLRQRSQLISKELLDLVNSNYEEFLSLGGRLKGGDEKIEQVRLGVLGFNRQVESVQAVVTHKTAEVHELLEERKRVRRHVMIGRRLLEIEERLEDLEARLMVEPASAGTEVNDSSDDDDDDDEEQDDATTTVLHRLRKHAQSYLLLTHLAQKLLDHPFVMAQQSRMLRLRNTLLLDLRTGLKQAQIVNVDGKQLLDFLVIYRELGEMEEGVRVLKGV